MDSATEMMLKQPQAPFLSRQAPRWASWLQGSAGTSFLALADQALVSGANFLTTILVGRMCLESELGIYVLGFTVGVVMVGVQQWLICAPYTVYVNRLEGRVRAEYAGSVLAHAGMLAALLAVGLLLLGAVCSGMGSVRLAPLLFLLALTVPCHLLREFARRCAFAELHVGTALGVDLAMVALQLGGLSCLAAGGTLSALSAHAVIGLACLVAGGAWLAQARKDFVVCWGQVRREWRRSWAFGKWICAGGVLGMVHGYLMHWLLLAVLGVAVTGLFAACATLVDLSNPLILGFANLAGPWTARSFADGGPVAVRRMVGQMLLLLGGAMTAFCVAMALFGGTLASWLFNGDYTSHGPTITVLALAALVTALRLAAGSGLWALERSRVNFLASVAGVIVTLVTACCLVVPLQVLGAAYGLLAGNLAAAAIQLVVLVRLTSGKKAELQ